MRHFLLSLAFIGCGGGQSATPSNPGVHFADDPEFQTVGNACLAEIASFGGYGKQLLDSLAAGSVTIMKGLGTASATAPTMKGERAVIEWSTASGTYGCSGAPKVACATLLHELAHAQENISGTGVDVGGANAQEEWGAVKAENWLLAQLGLCQRACYDSDGGDIAFPVDANVLWSLPSGSQQVSVVADGQVICQVVPTMLTLTIDNQSPDQVLVEGGSNKQLICGGNNPAFRETRTDRNCALVINYDPSNNPYAVPLTTLVAYIAGAGSPQWTDDSSADEPCGGNAYAEFCQIAMGKSGSTASPLSLSKPSSRTVHVRFVAK